MAKELLFPLFLFVLACSNNKPKAIQLPKNYLTNQTPEIDTVWRYDIKDKDIVPSDTGYINRITIEQIDSLIQFLE